MSDFGTDEPESEPDEDDLAELRAFGPIPADLLATIDGLPPLSRRGWISLELEAARAKAARGGREFDEAETFLVSDEFITHETLRELLAVDEVAVAAAKRKERLMVRCRELGYSWGELAVVLGVSRQSLHRRYRDR